MSNFSLKDQLFNQQKVTILADQINRNYPAFDKKSFVDDVCKAFPALELKQRINHIADCLHDYLPTEYMNALSVILQSLPPPLDETKIDNDFGDFIYAPYAAYVAKYGCAYKYLKRSLDAIKKITMRFSAEDAIRTFINTFPEETMETLLLWSSDHNYHVRRLASEGTRPRLPWSGKINIPYRQTVAILNALHNDKTRYVTRSVANHLNDITKIDPDLVINTLERWRGEKKQTEEELSYIFRHALRTLIKQGNKDALHLLGFSSRPSASVTMLQLKQKKIGMNDFLSFDVELVSKETEKLAVDYVIQFVTKNNKSSQKIFKLKTIRVEKGRKILLHKSHLMKQHMTTRTLYPGKHKITININGESKAATDFDLAQ